MSFIAIAHPRAMVKRCCGFVVVLILAASLAATCSSFRLLPASNFRSPGGTVRVRPFNGITENSIYHGHRIVTSRNDIIAQVSLSARAPFDEEEHINDQDEESESNIFLVQEEQQQHSPSSGTLINQLDSALSRFTSPVIDDPNLPLSDVLVAQIIAPSVQIAWLAINAAPSPSWLQPIFASSRDPLYGAIISRGSLLAPTLIHGAALAACWVLGALAAKAYERASISTDTLPAVIGSLLKAGAFASGVLILATQADLFLEYNGHWVQLGESPEIDFRLQVALVESVNDIFFEAVCILAWRVYLRLQTRSS